MKRTKCTFTLFFALLILLSSLSSCKQPEPEQTTVEPPVVVEPPVTESEPEPKEIPIISPVEAKPDPNAMSYEEYFSEERLINDSLWVVGPTFKFTVIDNSLYFTDDKGEPIAQITTQLFEKTFSYTSENAKFVVSSENEVFKLNEDYSVEHVATAVGPVQMKMSGDNMVMFYISDDTLYRVYLPTGQTDKLATLDNIFVFYIISNTDVMWHKFISNVESGPNTGGKILEEFIYSSLTDKNYPTADFRIDTQNLYQRLAELREKILPSRDADIAAMG